MSSKRTILLVEDDERLGALLRDYLESHDFDVHWEDRGDRVLERIRTSQPKLVILDLMLPGMDGFEICRRARADYNGGILILTASKTQADELVGLELGADDFISKPVEPRVLLARVRSLMRRISGELAIHAIPTRSHWARS